MAEVDDRAGEAVGDRRAGRAPRSVAGAEHEVIDQQLRPPGEQAGERCRALVGVEPVFLADADSGAWDFRLFRCEGSEIDH
jgi:hypothetical protein